jgi:hypothetical protein
VIDEARRGPLDFLAPHGIAAEDDGLDGRLGSELIDRANGHGRCE